MSKPDRSDFLDNIERDIPTTPEDVIALRETGPSGARIGWKTYIA